MPWGDGTGPWWAQGRWRCWYGGRGFGRGYGRGFGRGFGRGYGPGYRAVQQGADYQPTPQVSREGELSELKAYAGELKAELDEIKKRIAELEKK